jgi:hypothetical protein
MACRIQVTYRTVANRNCTATCWLIEESPFPDKNRHEILIEYAAYAQKVEDAQGPRLRSTLIKVSKVIIGSSTVLKDGLSLANVSQPVLGLFTGEKNGRLFRSRIDNYLRAKGSDGLTPVSTLGRTSKKCCRLSKNPQNS